MAERVANKDAPSASEHSPSQRAMGMSVMAVSDGFTFAVKMIRLTCRVIAGKRAGTRFSELLPFVKKKLWLTMPAGPPFALLADFGPKATSSVDLLVSYCNIEECHTREK